MSAQYERAVFTAVMTAASEMAACLSANCTFTTRTLMVPLRATEYASVDTFGPEEPLPPAGGGVWKTCGIGSAAGPPGPAVAVGAGVGGGAVVVGAGVGGGAVVVGAGALLAGAVGVGALVAGVAGVAAGIGAGDVWAHAGELTAGNEARERASAAISAVLFRIEFTVCLS
jgi:hypothetical protein